MRVNGPDEIRSKASWARGGGLPGLLRVVAPIAVVVGTAGSVGITLWVGHRNPSRLLVALFAIWVTSPFMALLLANMVSKRWSALTRVTLHSVMLILTVGSLATYADVALSPPKSTPAFVFVVVPLASWLLMTIVVPMAALISGRLTRRGGGA